MHTLNLFIQYKKLDAKEGGKKDGCNEDGEEQNLKACGKYVPKKDETEAQGLKLC